MGQLIMVPIWIVACVAIQVITWRAGLWAVWQRPIIAAGCALLGWVAYPLDVDPPGALWLLGGLWLAFVVQMAIIARRTPPMAATPAQAGPRRSMGMRWVWPQPRYKRQATTARYRRGQ